MTTKQQLAAQKLLENGGNVGKAMRAAGYSEAMAKNPQKLTRSKGWQELMEKFLPDKTLLQVHQEGLQANKIVSARIIGADATEQTDDFIEVPDHPTRHKFLETAYKIKKRLGVDTLQQINATQVNQFSDLTDAQLDVLIKQTASQIKPGTAPAGEKA